MLYYLYICLVRLKKKHTTNPFKAHAGLQLQMEETYKISELSKTAMKLYLHIREYSFRTNGCIVFDFAVAKGLCGFKQNKSVYNALSELIEQDIIAGTEDSVEFYYNPRFISNEKE